MSADRNVSEQSHTCVWRMFIYMYAAEYPSVIEGNKVLIHGATWVSLEALV